VLGAAGAGRAAPGAARRAWGFNMPTRETLARAERDKRQGKSSTTQAGEFVREEMHHIREGKHGARSAKQAIAIGLSKARRAGVELPPPAPGRAAETTRRKAARDYARGHRAGAKRRSDARRAGISRRALNRETHAAAAPSALATQARAAAARRSRAERAAAAQRAARVKGRSGRSAAAKRAARTRKARAEARA
jgi:hypothetical protein